MTCPYCREHFAARSAERLTWRRERIDSVPQADVYPCPRCGGKDWIDTEEMIGTRWQAWLYSWPHGLLAAALAAFGWLWLRR
jgi:hypothetical protein